MIPLGPTGLKGDGRGWIILTVGFGWFMALGTRFVVPAVLPEIRSDLGISNAAAGIAITALWITYGAMQFPAGALVDRVGERRLLTVSALVGGAGLLAIAGSPTYALLLVAAAAFGVGTGLYGPARATILSRTFPDNDGAAFGVVLACGSLGSAALPLIAGVLTGRIGWRLAVGGFVPVFGLVAVGLWLAVPTRAPGDGTSLALRDRLKGLRNAIGRRSVIVPGFALMFILYAFQGFTAFFPTYLVIERGFSQALAASVFAGMFVAGAAFQVVVGALADRLGHKPVLVATATGSVLPLVALPVATGLPAITAISLLFGLRFAATPLTNSYIVRVLPGEVQGTAWGVLRTAFFLVGATASSTVGFMADRGLFDEAFVLLAVVTAGGAICYALMPARESVA